MSETYEERAFNAENKVERLEAELSFYRKELEELKTKNPFAYAVVRDSMHEETEFFEHTEDAQKNACEGLNDTHIIKLIAQPF